MTQLDFINALNALQSSANAYSQTALTTYPQFEVSRVVGDRANVGPFIVNNDWSGLNAYCQSKLSNASGTFGSIQAEQAQINGLYAQLFALKSYFSTYYLAPKTNPTWVNSRRSDLENQLLSQGLSQGEVSSLLSNVENKGGQKGYSFLRESLDQFPKLLSFAFERHLAKVTSYEFTKAIADFNVLVGTPQSLAYNVSNRISSLSSGIATRQATVLAKIQSGDIAGAISRCTINCNWIDAKLQSDILPIIAYCYQVRQMTGSNFVTDGRRAQKAGELLQTAIYAKAAFLLTKWRLQWHPEASESKEIVAKATALSNAPVALSGTTVSIANLQNSPAIYDGVDVLVEGVVSNLTITHLTATKVVSTAEIGNAAGTTVKVVIPHIKLDSGGFVNGAYVKVAGTFRQVNPEANNQIALSIGRFPITTLAKTSWQAWLRSELRAIFEPVAHSLTILFSAQPSNDGAINPVKYSTTSAASKSLTITNNAY